MNGKYRGKRVDNGEWVYGGFIQYHKKSFISNFPNRKSFLGGFEKVISSSVGQSTGQKDKNGIEIYGKCKIKYLDAIWKIVWNNDRAGFEYESFTWEKNQHSWKFDCIVAGVCEVIHDDPKLLVAKE